MNLFFKLRSSNCLEANPISRAQPEPASGQLVACPWRESLKLHTHPHSEKGRERERRRGSRKEVSRKAAWAGNVPVLALCQFGQWIKFLGALLRFSLPPHNSRCLLLPPSTSSSFSLPLSLLLGPTPRAISIPHLQRESQLDFNSESNSANYRVLKLQFIEPFWPRRAAQRQEKEWERRWEREGEREGGRGAPIDCGLATLDGLPVCASWPHFHVASSCSACCCCCLHCFPLFSSLPPSRCLTLPSYDKWTFISCGVYLNPQGVEAAAWGCRLAQFQFQSLLLSLSLSPSLSLSLLLFLASIII